MLESHARENMNKHSAFPLMLYMWEKLMEEGQGGQMKFLHGLHSPASLILYISISSYHSIVKFSILITLKVLINFLELQQESSSSCTVYIKYIKYKYILNINEIYYIIFHSNTLFYFKVTTLTGTCIYVILVS